MPKPKTCWNRIKIRLIISANLTIFLTILAFAVFYHDPFSSISDDIRPITVMENVYTSNSFSLREKPGGHVGINETVGQNGRVYSASLLGTSLWYYPAFLLGKAYNNLMCFPAGMAPRANWIFADNTHASQLSNNGEGDWAPVFARAMNAILLPFIYFLLVGVAKTYHQTSHTAHMYAISVLFGTQLLLLNHSNYDHTLNAFGLLLAFYCTQLLRHTATQVAALLCGLGLAICITTRIFSISYLPIFAVYIFLTLYSQKRLNILLTVAAPVACGFAINAWYNWLRTGKILSSGYDEKWIQFDPPIVGIYRYLATIDHSVFIHSPILVAGAWAAARQIKLFRPAYFFPTSLAAGHILFYLCWHYPGGEIVPLRFFSEIFFIVMLPVCSLISRQKVGLGYFICLFIGFANSILLSFIDVRRTSITTNSFFTWRTPVIPVEFRIVSANSERLITLLKDALSYGWPDWLGLQLTGTTGVFLFGICLLAVSSKALIQSVGASHKFDALARISLGCAAATILLLAISLPSPDTGSNLSNEDFKLKDLNVQYNYSGLILTGSYAGRSSAFRGVQVILRRTTPPELTLCREFPLTFGAHFLNTSVLALAKDSDDFAEFRHVLELPDRFPPGEYEVTLQVTGSKNATRLASLEIPNMLDYTTEETFLSSPMWLFNSTCTTENNNPIIEPGTYAATAIRLPSGHPEKIACDIYASPIEDGHLTLVTNTGKELPILISNGKSTVNLSINNEVQTLILKLKCEVGSFMFAGINIYPM